MIQHLCNLGFKNPIKTVLLFVTFVTFSTANATNYYFSSTSGDDNRSSTQAQNPATPWQSLKKLNAYFSYLQPGDSVLFKRGDVFYGTITVKKSGQFRMPIVFSAFGAGANPIISGLSNMGNWVSIGKGLYETTLTTPPSNPLMMVLFDGNLQPVGRFPKAGLGKNSYFYISTPDPITSTTTINSNDISGVPSFVGGELVQKKEQWIIDRSVITSQNSNTIVSTPYVSPDHPGVTYKSLYKHGFFFQNHVNACTQLGEWCYNNSNKKLTMFFGANNPNDYSVQAATQDSLVYINAQSYITFTGLTFSGANQHLIKMQEANNIIINNCDVAFSGMNGITVDRKGWYGDTHNNTISNSNIHHINNNGIELVGSTYWNISGNYIHDIGMVSGMGLNGDAQYIGIFNVGGNSVVELNKIENIGYSGIYFSGDNTIIRKNELKNYVAIKSDGGGIYTYEASGANRLIENNICHGGIGDYYAIAIDESNPFPGQVHGIYMDGNTTNVTIRNNTCFDNSRSGIWVGSNGNVSVYDNLCYNNEKGQISGYDVKGPFSNMTIKRNILFAKKQEQLCLSVILGYNYYSQAFTQDSNYFCRPISETQGITTLGYPNNGSYVNYPGGGVVEGYDLKFYSLDTWQKLSGVDANTKKTPISISSLDDILFEYNASNTNKMVPLSTTYMDVKGNSYSGSVTLAPYTSIILMKHDGSAIDKNLGYYPIPGRVEAENNIASQGIMLESCSEGGQDIGGVGQGSWMDYNVAVEAAGTYTMNFRVGGWGGGQFQIRNSNGTVLSTVNVPSAGGWQKWITVGAPVNLPAGQQTLRLYVTSPGFTFNWFEGLSANNQNTDYKPIPGRIEAEAYYDMQGVLAESCSEGGQNTSGFGEGSWMDYKVNVSAAGTYTMNFRAGGWGGQLQVRNSSGTVLGTVNIPSAGGWQKWITTSASISLPAGQQILRLYITSPGITLNWFEGLNGSGTVVLQNQSINFATIPNKQTTDPAFTLSATSSAGLPISYRVLYGPATINGNTVTLTGQTGTVSIEASQGGNSTYSAATPVTQSFSVSAASLQNQTITFPSIANKMTSDAAFTLSATTSSGLPVSYKVVSGPATVSGNTVSLTGVAGTVVIEATQNGNTTYNAATPVRQSFSVNAPVLTGYLPIPGRIEAESFSSQQWVILENCSEGGQNTGGFGPGSLMEYKVNVSAAGTYTFNFRVGGWGGQLQVQNAAGSVLRTLDVPSAGGWSQWKTVSTTVTLPAGQQSLRLYVTSPGFTINWFEGVGSTALQGQSINFPAVSSKTIGDLPFALNATASSGLPVSYRVVSGPATVLGNIVTLTGLTGTVTIEATQSGNSTFAAATPVTQSFSVGIISTLLPGYYAIPGRVEAEKYNTQQWVLLENCSEGGQSVGGFGPGSLMDYMVNVASAGTYTFNFRVGGWGGQFQIKNANGTVLRTVDVPSAGGWSQWKTVSTTVTLPAGQQSLRLSITTGGFTLNWFEGVNNSALMSTSGLPQARKTTEEITTQTAAAGFSIYPVPVQTELTLQLQNAYTGAVRVRIVDEAGRLRKEVRLQKEGSQLVQKLSVGELNRGYYVMQVQMGDKTESKSFIKQ